MGLGGGSRGSRRFRRYRNEMKQKIGHGAEILTLKIDGQGEPASHFPSPENSSDRHCPDIYPHGNLERDRVRRVQRWVRFHSVALDTFTASLSIPRRRCVHPARAFRGKASRAFRSAALDTFGNRGHTVTHDIFIQGESSYTETFDIARTPNGTSAVRGCIVNPKLVERTVRSL